MKKYTYITLLTTDSYLPGVFILNQCLAKVKSKYPLLVLITDDISKVARKQLDLAHIKYMEVNKLQTPDHIYEHNKQLSPAMADRWKYCNTKYELFNLTEFDKIIFLDADLLILKNLDHCFELPHMTAAVDGEYSNVWPEWPHFNTGFFVIEPNKTEYRKIINFANNLNPKAHKLFSGEYMVFSDQEILNLYYNDWPNRTDLHLNKYYNIFPNYVLASTLPDILQNAYFIHYVGIKPWRATLSEIGELSDAIWCFEREQNTLCLYFYELGATYTYFDNLNQHQKINWADPEVIKDFKLAFIKCCLDLFRDFGTALIYIENFLKEDPSNSDCLQLKQNADNLKLATEAAPVLISLYNLVINNLSINDPKYSSRTAVTLTHDLTPLITSQAFIDHNIGLYSWAQVNYILHFLEQIKDLR